MTFHFWLTKLAVHLGGANPLVMAHTRRACRPHGVSVRFRDQALELTQQKRRIRIAAGQFGYAPHLAQHFEVYFSAVTALERDGYEIVDYSTPRLQTARNSGVEFEMASFPEDEGAADAYLRFYQPKPGDLIFDVGAHCGVSTYLFSKAVGPAGRVVAFEPDRLNYALLLRNIKRHRLRNVTAVRVAIGGRSGRAQFNSEGTQGSGLSRHFQRASLGTTEMVDVLTLDDAFDRWGVPAFLKMDIEGAEVEALTGAAGRLSREHVPIALDTSHVVNGVRTQFEVEKVLRECGYAVESAEVNGFMNTWGARVDTPAQSGP